MLIRNYVSKDRFVALFYRHINVNQDGTKAKSFVTLDQLERSSMLYNYSSNNINAIAA